MAGTTGTFALMLHGHIPYCKKSGVWPAGEEWLFEAMNETYVPLLRKLREFKLEQQRPRIIVGVVPVLAEQLADEYMKTRFSEYMEDKIQRAERDAARFHGDPARRAVAEYWRDTYVANLEAFHQLFYRDVLGTLKWLQDEGVVEVVTSAATHGFLPLLEQDSSVYAQIHLGVETYRKYFQCDPKGFWLPECAYRPAKWSDRENRTRKGLDEWLAEEGVEYFFVEDVGITRAEFVDNKYHEDRPTTYRGYQLPSGVCVFGRNQVTSKQVWSPEYGYPGDPHYLEFHRKDPESGLHYWRVTGATGEKAIYDPGRALERVEAHATHFVSLIQQDLAAHRDVVTAAGADAGADADVGGEEGGEVGPLIVAPYDWELYGHWWHEGVEWIDRVYRKLADTPEVATRTLSEVVSARAPEFSTIQMGPSTWGENSDFTVWLNDEHGWIWPYINACSRDMEDVLAQLEHQAVTDRGQRVLQQLARELLLLQGSDWPFLLYTRQAKEYANQRFHKHHQWFNRLLWAAKDITDEARIQDALLRQITDVDSPWPDVDYFLFKHRE